MQMLGGVIQDGPGADVVTVDDLHIRYGDVTAVDGVSLSIKPGEIFGILGPNGAGKTTTVECIGGLRRPDSGAVRVLGLDPMRDHEELRERVGMQLQFSGLPDKLRVGEAMGLFAGFYRDPGDPDELLSRLGLADKRGDRFANLSGGQKQRLSIALALIGQPELAILDELTTGLDPQSRRETWKLIEDVRARGVTVILVTHFMEEAQYLCDRVALLHHGQVIATDTPAALGAGVGERVSFVATEATDPELFTALPEVRSATVRGGRLVIEGTGDLTAAVVRVLVERRIVPEGTRIEQSTLDDAFVTLTAEPAAGDGAHPVTSG